VDGEAWIGGGACGRAGTCGRWKEDYAGFGGEFVGMSSRTMKRSFLVPSNPVPSNRWSTQSAWRLIPYTRPSGSGRGPGSGRGRPLCGRPKRERKPPHPPALVPVRSAPVRSPAMSASLRPQLRPPGPGFAPGGAADLRASPALVFLCSCLPEGLWERPRMVGCEWPEHDVRPQTEDRSTGGALAEPRRRKTPLVLPRKLSGERLKGRGFAQPPEPGPLPQRERQRGSCL